MRHAARRCRALQRDDFVDFLAARYRPDRLIIAAAGDITHEALERWAARDFGHLTGSGGAGRRRAAARRCAASSRSRSRSSRCTSASARPASRRTAEERYAAYLLNTALGGGMSSRLFQEIREKRGHAYSVFSFLSSFRDAGYLGIYVGTVAGVGRRRSSRVIASRAAAPWRATGCGPTSWRA